MTHTHRHRRRLQNAGPMRPRASPPPPRCGAPEAPGECIRIFVECISKMICKWCEKFLAAHSIVPPGALGSPVALNGKGS
eukprot:scaffold99479_cov18-Tisochrysis_lutea.AAC.1